MMKTAPDELGGILEEIGVVITDVRGRRIHGLCPKHFERLGRVDSKPSWSIDQDTHLFHCFSCGYGGTLTNLIVDVLGRSPDWAVDWLGDHARRRAVRSARQVGQPQPPAWAPSKPPKPVEGLLGGFCDPPDKALARRNLERFAAVHYGIKWDPEDRSWILPIRLDNGELVGYQRKKKHVVRNHPPRMQKRATLFGIDKFPENRPAILVESPLDVARLYSAGIAGGLSSFGVHVSDEQMWLILEHTDEVVLALDNDPEGQADTARLWRQWGTKLKMSIVVYGVTGVKDPGEMSDTQLHGCLLGAESALFWRPAVREKPGRIRRGDVDCGMADVRRVLARILEEA